MLTLQFQFRTFIAFIRISIYSSRSGSPLIGEMVGSSEYDARRGILHWKIPLIDSSSPSGSMEFNVKGNVPASAFFPVRVTFKSNQTFCAIQV